MNNPHPNRRELLAGAGLALAGASLPAAGSSIGSAAEGGRATVVLHDRGLPVPEDISRRLAGDGARILALEDDPVRMWRGELAPLLAARSTRLLGVTNWPQFLLVRGLAAESGRRVRYQRFEPRGDAIVWLVA